MRNKIINKLDVITASDEHLALLTSISDVNSRVNLDLWLKGCIESLKYKPNRTCAIFTGENPDKIINVLFPAWLPVTTGNLTMAEATQYRAFIHILDRELDYYSKVKQLGSLCMSDGFKVEQNDTDFPDVDKRLSSFCATIDKWIFPQRKDMVVIDTDSVDEELLLSVNVDLLWIELYHKYNR